MARGFQYQKQEQQKGFAPLLLFLFWLATLDISYLHSCWSALPSSSSWLHLIDTGPVCLSLSPATLITNGSMTSTHLSFQVDATDPLIHQVISLNSTLHTLPIIIYVSHSCYPNSSPNFGKKRLRFLTHQSCIDHGFS